VHRLSVESSAIESVGYDARSRTLEVEFAGGGLYRYFGVPVRAYELLLRADSHGAYVNRRIKPYYRCRRVAT
jgi:KTSC domain